MLRIPHDSPRSGAGRTSTSAPVHEVCPFLVAADGGWRSALPSREHRCGATVPPAAPVVGKQRDTCLVDAHARCATYLAARELEVGSAGGRVDLGGGFWPETRTTILALEPARGRVVGRPGSRGRAGGQALLVGLMVLAFLVLVIARTSPPSATGGPAASVPGGLAASGSPAAGTGSPDAGASAAGGASPTAVPSAVTSPGSSPVPGPASAPPSAPSSDGPSPEPTSKATPAAGRTPIPAGSTTYTVRSGDTLNSIAARFGTTAKSLKSANGIIDASLIRVGQVLVIP